jgi:hypothetical protein
MPDHEPWTAGNPGVTSRGGERGRSDAGADDGDDDCAQSASSTAPSFRRSSEHGSTIAGPQAVAEEVLHAFNTWHFKREQPADPHLMLQIISDAIGRQAPVSFVLYWGKGPRCSLGESDARCLDFLAGLASRVREAYLPGAAIELIFTDTHAELNGHSRQTMRKYFAEVEVAARQRGFGSCWLGQLTRTPEIAAADTRDNEIVPEETLLRLGVSAAKWYRGDGSAEHGALKYYRINMVEKRAVELAFPNAIFITFNGSKFRNLFPQHLPIFYMYSLRRGVSVKPWFLPADAARCEGSSCHCTVVQP